MPVQFHRPETVQDAVRLKRDLGDGAFYLAGGTELNAPWSAEDPEHLIFLGGLGLRKITETPDALTIGACATFQDVADSQLVPPALQRAAMQMGNRNVRNVATVGGHIVTGRSCGDLIPALIALHAFVVISATATNERLAVEDFVSQGRKGLVTEIRIPWLVPSRLVGLAHYSRTATDLSIVNAAASLWRDGNAVKDVVVALGGMGPKVVRLKQVERALEGWPLPPAGDLEVVVANHVRPIGDLRGSAVFKKHLAGVLVARAVVEAWRAEEGR